MDRWKQEAELRLAEALGRPVRRCPGCDEIGAHWTSETLDERGDLVPGFFTCRPVVAAEGSVLFEIDGGA